MTLLELIDKKLIIVPLASSERSGIIKEMVDCYATSRGLDAVRCDEITSAVLERETLGSTAMGHGIAIPHAKIKGLGEMAVVIALAKEPVDFGGEEKTSVFFLVLTDEDKPSEHIALLSSIARLCSSDSFVRLLSRSRNADEVKALFFD